MQLIILTGKARSGKDTVADYIAEKYGFKKLVFSDFIAREAAKQGLEPSKMNLAKMGDILRKKMGMHAPAELLWEEAKKHEKVVASAARSPEEIEFLKEKADKVLVIEVAAGEDKRFERRDEQDPEKRDEFFSRDRLDLKKKGLKKATSLAEHTITNNSTINDLENQIDEVMDKFYKAG